MSSSSNHPECLRQAGVFNLRAMILALLGILIVVLALACRGDAPPAPRPAPKIQAFTPASGPEGTVVTLTGSGFKGVTQVTFNGEAGMDVSGISDAEASATVPRGATSGPIVLVTSRGSGTSATPFKVTPALKVTGFSPTKGPEGTPVTLQGSRLDQTTRVLFGGKETQTFTAAPDGQSITVAVPPGAATGPLVVDTPVGSVTAPPGDYTVLPPVALSGFSPSQGLVGTSVTIQGSGLDQVTQVDFQGAGTTEFTRATDGNSLTVAVPAGATTGPVAVVTGQGSKPVPGGNFTVLLPAPQLTGFSPASGVPGTAVTLQGSHLTGITQVSFGGTALPAAAFTVVSDSQVVAYVPDGATADGAFQVARGGQASASSQPFTLLPSRLAIYSQALTKNTNAVLGIPDLAFTELDFPSLRRTQQYAAFHLPWAPVFHAYNPGNPAMRADHWILKTTINFKLPATFLEALPQSLKDKLQQEGIDPANLDILCVSQDYPYDGGTPNDGIYLFRPHYWADPTAPNTYPALGFNHVFNLQGGIFQADPGITVSGHAQGELFPFSISVHDDGSPAGYMLSSSNTEPVAGFDVNTSMALWSLVKMTSATPTNPLVGRAAATLHVFLNDADQEALQAVAQNATSFIGFLQALATSPLNGTRAHRALQQLTRPIVHQIVQVPDASGTTKRVTLTGTGLAGATSVTLDGAPVGAIKALSDAALAFEVDATAAGTLIVETPLGESDPFPLPRR